MAKADSEKTPGGPPVHFPDLTPFAAKAEIIGQATMRIYQLLPDTAKVLLASVLASKAREIVEDQHQTPLAEALFRSLHAALELDPDSSEAQVTNRLPANHHIDAYFAQGKIPASGFLRRSGEKHVSIFVLSYQTEDGIAHRLPLSFGDISGIRPDMVEELIKRTATKTATLSAVGNKTF